MDCTPECWWEGLVPALVEGKRSVRDRGWLLVAKCTDKTREPRWQLPNWNAKCGGYVKRAITAFLGTLMISFVTRVS